MVPSVMMNGTTLSRLVSSPLTSPARQPVARQAAIAGPAPQPFVQNPSQHRGRQRKSGADRQIDAAGDNDYRHSQRGHGDCRRLHRRGAQVAHRPKAGPLAVDQPVGHGEQQHDDQQSHQRTDRCAKGMTAAAEPDAGRGEQSDVERQPDQGKPGQFPPRSPASWPATEYRPPRKRPSTKPAMRSKDSAR